MKNTGSVDSYGWYAKMLGAYAVMSDSLKDSLHQWESRSGGETSSWPGWASIIGVPPWLGRELPPAKKKAHIKSSLRKQVYERDGYRCVQCAGWVNLSVDHIIPESQGGTTTLGNLQTMCVPCNIRKGARA